MALSTAMVASPELTKTSAKTLPTESGSSAAGLHPHKVGQPCHRADVSRFRYTQMPASP
jgi:hypothetical protein